MPDSEFEPYGYTGETLYLTIRDDYELHHPIEEPIVPLGPSWEKIDRKVTLWKERNALVRQEFVKWWDSLSDEDKIKNAYRVLRKKNQGGAIPPIPEEVAKALLEFGHGN